MKEIMAIIRPGAWQKTKTVLMDAGFTSLTQQRVFGRDKQKGLRYMSQGKQGIRSIPYLPKRMVTIVVADTGTV